MPVKTEQYKNHTIEVDYDSEPINPREDDNLCVIHIAHRQYNFGDKNYAYYDDIKDVEQEALRNKDIVLPLYMFDHSGIRISLSPFICPWDSGQVGFVQIPCKKILESFGKKRLSKVLKQKALDIARAEVEELDSHISGENYKYNISGENYLSSCSGFHSVEEALECAKGEIGD